MDESDDAQSLITTDTEIKELLGLFDAPAFARRGRDLEDALARLHARCERARDGLLEMLRLRLRQWGAVATGPDDHSGVFHEPIAALWTQSGAELPVWSAQAGPPRRRRAVARDLVASVIRFNHRWEAYLDQLNLEPVNRMIDQYNRYYVLEKECVLGSTRLALRYFSPRARLSRVGLSLEYPAIPVPELIS
jgi:hypothetical protein